MSEKENNEDKKGFSGDENSKDNFGVPENYFESFSARLFKKLGAEDELKDYPLLSKIGKVNPFAVPQGYFELREELLQYPHLRELRVNRFVSPANYFEEVSAGITNAIGLNEELKQYAQLSSIEKQNVFAVPENYFVDSAKRILAKTQEAKVVPLSGRIKRYYQFAAAAAVVFIIALSIFFYNRENGAKSTECTTIACLSKKEILNSNYMQSVSEDNIIEMIDVKALSDSLSLKKNGKTEKVDAEEVSEEVDVNTITESL